MARVFLSYVREDIEKARAVAAALENAGHSVWWDRHIKGGAQFASEIEAALNSADKVVVLWSKRSISSAWVRDEAAVGRDSVRLVPVTIDSTEPPLGFRQYQTIHLSRSAAKSKSSDFAELLDAIGAAGERSAVTVAPGAMREPPRWRLLSAAMLALLVIGGTWWWWTSRAAAHTPVVAIETASHAPTSRAVARELAVRLGDLQSARADAFQLVTDSHGADLIVQVDAVDGASDLQRDLSVLSGKNRSILWSTSLQQRRSKADDLAQEVTLSIGRVLQCALDALSDQHDTIDPGTLKLYLAGCSRSEDLYGLGQYDPGLDKLFDEVIAKAPHLEGAWAKLLALESETVKNPGPPPALVQKLKKHIAQAEKLGLDIGELYVARAALLPNNDFARVYALYDQGIRADPDDPYIYRMRSEKSQEVGRMNSSVSDASQALQLDPLSPALMDNYISALAYAGKVDAAYVQLRTAEAMWPTASNLRFARYRLDLRYGDPKEALSIYRSSSAQASFPEQESFIEARIDPSPANVQRAIDAERANYRQEPRYIAGLMQALGQFGRKGEAIDALLNYGRPDAVGSNAGVLFRPALKEMWRDPRAMAAAAHVGLAAFWKKSGLWPDFCYDPTLSYDCKKEAAKYR